MSSSLRKWFLDLPWMQQGVLLGSFRNCDGIWPEGHHKELIRGVRAACIKAAKTKGSFNARRPDREKITHSVNEFVKYFDHIPIHFVSHLMYAAEVLAYSHPDEYIRDTWIHVYATIVKALHLNMELVEDFRKRLSDDPDQVVREDAHDSMCYETGKYGENVGTRNEGDSQHEQS